MKTFCIVIFGLLLIVGYQGVYAQQPLAQQAFALFEQHCLNCHGEFGSYSDVLTIKHRDLIEDHAVLPGQPDASELYLRLLGDTDSGSQMPLGQEPLDANAIATIRRWIEGGAPDWEAIPKPKRSFITTEAMLKTIHTHVASLTAFDRSFARYFTLTHLYNAGASDDNLRAYRNALSKLVNSLSWGAEVIKPVPVDPEETIFYIDVRHYEWDIKSDKWYKIEQAYPYDMQLKSSTYTTLCQETACELPFVRADWFIATASLPPLYHEILGLPETDKELETYLEVNVSENLKNAPGVRVWRAGFSESGVSVNNRIVERHRSRYGAYWKSYDFAGNVGTQNIFTHPLNFTHDGGEIIFNLPNGLQAYYLSTATGERLDAAPINIVSDAGARDPVVRNGLSCMGCHTEGMKTFEDQVRSVIEQDLNPSYDKAQEEEEFLKRLGVPHLNPSYDKAQALRLYTEKSEMDRLVREDIARYRRAIEAAGGVFGGSEPIQQLVKQFEGPLDATHAAAEVGLETADFLEHIRENDALRDAALLVLGVDKGGVKRDAWESLFGGVVSVLQSSAKTVYETEVLLRAAFEYEGTKPRFRNRVEPIFPQNAKRGKKEGEVLLRATIDVNGMPQHVVPLTNLGFGLEEAAIEALKKTTFYPATQAGKPVIMPVEVLYKFTADEGSKMIESDRNFVQPAWTLEDVLAEAPGLGSVDFDPEPGVTAPKIKFLAQKKYPDVAKKAEKEGKVVLKVTIDENGISQNIVALTSLGFGLEEAAIEMLKRSTFRPATKRGKPISLEVEIPVDFTLKDHLSPPMGMVLIPADEFQMGSNDSNVNSDEKPVHTVYLDAFYIDKYEVTNAQYKAFIDANPEWQKDRILSIYHSGSYLQHWKGNNYPIGKGNHPVDNVSWYAAMAYSKWAGKRLPTEAEWEKAARGDLIGQKYPWGDSIDPSQANYNRSIGGTTLVGQYAPNAYGLYDMAGNVWEWCLDSYQKNFYARSPRRNPVSDGSRSGIISNFIAAKSARVLRGGSWYSTAPNVRCADRYYNTPTASTNYYGFRCVKDVKP